MSRARDNNRSRDLFDSGFLTVSGRQVHFWLFTFGYKNAVYNNNKIV